MVMLMPWNSFYEAQSLSSFAPEGQESPFRELYSKARRSGREHKAQGGAEGETQGQVGRAIKPVKRAADTASGSERGSRSRLLAEASLATARGTDSARLTVHFAQPALAPASHNGQSRAQFCKPIKHYYRNVYLEETFSTFKLLRI